MRFEGIEPPPLASLATPLAQTALVGPNPGNLRMFSYRPAALKGGAPLVVVLHGCGQTAPGYVLGAGWTQLADRLGFAVLAAEQKAANNPGACFNWFNSEDAARGQGEAASIAAMIAQMLTAHALDARRVFITGLSAGGAMTAAMLAAYPDIFAGGAIIAGLPVGAGNIRDAMDSMRGAPLLGPRAWGDKVRAASNHTVSNQKGPWPAVTIWHGDLDATVHVNNAQASAAQWADVMGLSLPAARRDSLDGAVRLRWGNRLEVVIVPGLGHGTPIDPADVGVPAPFILDAGISSSTHIARFWGLAPAAAKSAARPASRPVAAPLPWIQNGTAVGRQTENLIRRALKAAGLFAKG